MNDPPKFGNSAFSDQNWNTGAQFGAPPPYPGSSPAGTQPEFSQNSWTPAQQAAVAQMNQGNQRQKNGKWGIIICCIFLFLFICSMVILPHLIIGAAIAGGLEDIFCTYTKFDEIATTENRNLYRSDAFQCEDDGRGNVLLFSGQRKNFQRSNETCSGYNAQIVQIFDTDYNDMVNNFVIQHLSRVSIWVGTNDFDFEGQWSGNYSNWYPGEPNSWGDFGAYTGDEDCAILLAPYGLQCSCYGHMCEAEGQWLDVSCEEEHMVICQGMNQTCTDIQLVNPLGI